MEKGYSLHSFLKFHLLGILFFILSVTDLFAVTTYYSRASGNWNSNTKWSTVACGNATNTGTFPVAGDTVIICTGHSMSVNVNAACASITTQGSGNLDFPTNTITLTVSGDVTLAGTGGITAIAGGGSASRVMNIGGQFIVSAGANLPLGGLTMTVTGVSTIDGMITCTDNTGSKTFNDNVNLNATGSIWFNATETYTINANLFMTNGSTIGGTSTGILLVSGTFNVLSAAGVATVGRCSMTISGLTTIDGYLMFGASGAGTKTFRAVTVNATGVWDNTVGEDPRMNGNIINNGSWIGNTGGTADYQFGRTVGGSYTITGNPVVFSRLSIEDGTTVTNLGTVIIDGNVNPGIRNRNGNGNATYNNGDGIAAAVLYIQNSGGADGADLLINKLTFNASLTGNTVYYSRGGNQNIRIPDDACYYNLICGISGTKASQTGTIGIRNLLTIKENAIVDVGTNTLADGCGGTAGLTMLDNAQLLLANCAATVPELTGTYTLTGGSITLNGNCAQTLRGGVAYNDLIFSGNNPASSVDMTGVIAINGNLTISGQEIITGNSVFTMDCLKTFTYSSSRNTTISANMNIGSFSQTGAGTFDDGGKTITVCGSSWIRTAGTYSATGTVIFNGITTMGGTSITTFNNVIINPAKTLIADPTTMGVAGSDFTNDGTFTHNNGTVTFNGAGTTLISGASFTTFNHFTISSGTVKGHSTEMSINGNFTNNSSFNHNAGKVIFSGGAAQSISGTTSPTGFGRLEINKTFGTVLTQNLADVTVKFLFTMTEGIFSVGTNTLTGSMACGFTATGGDLQIAKLATLVPEFNNPFAITGGTVTLNGAGDQTLKTSPTGADTYNNLVFSTSGIKTIAGLLTINGDVTVSGTATLTANSNFIQNSAKTFNYNSTGVTTLTSSVAVTVGSYSQTAGTFNINTNAANVFSVSGATWNKSGGTFTNTNPSKVLFNGVVAQAFTDNGTVFANVEINNVNHLLLNSNISISTNLIFTLGNITTGVNKAILTTNATAVTGASQITGFVDGNFQKYVSTSPKTFEIGSGGNYAPLNLIFASITTAGNLICSTTPNDHVDINASDIDPNKTINRYWTIDFATLVVTTFDPTFNYPSADVDGGADVTVFGAQQYNAIAWSNLTISGIPTTTATIITGIPGTSAPTARDYIIGERFNPNGLYNAVTGAMNWNLASNWIRYRTGQIISTLGDPIIFGVSTIFTTELVPGDVILSQNAPGVALGTVLSVDNDGQITLTAGASATTSFSYGIQAIPGITDEVNIGNPYIAGAAVDVTLDIPSTIYKLIFTRMAFSNSLIHGAANALTITNNVVLNQPSGVFTNTWNIAAGSASLGGNLMIGSNDATASRIAKVMMTTGTLTISTNLVFFMSPNAAAAANAVMDLSGGACTLNMSGNFTLTNTGNNWGTFTPGASSIVNYNKSNAATTTQIINLTTVAPAVTYANLNLNNTSLNTSTGIIGATISKPVTAAMITGNMRIQSGKFYTSGWAIAGNAGKTFEVADSAIFELTGTSAFPTGFTIFTFGPKSITQYHQVNFQWIKVIAAPGYGHLQLQPKATINHSFQAGTTLVQGNLDIGNGTNIVTLNSGVAAITVSVTGNITIFPNATFNITNFTNTPAVRSGGDWTNNGGTFTPSTKTVTFNGTGAQQINGTQAAQTFYNVIVAKTAGTTLSVGGSTTTLTTNNLTINSGTLSSPATLNINSTDNAVLTLAAAGNMDGNASSISITGNWVNNGGIFNAGTSTVNFTGLTARQINGSAVAQTFNNIVINKTNVTLSTGGSTTTITSNDFTLSDGNYTAPATMNINGNMLVNGTSGADTYTSGANTNISGNITFNTGSLTWGTNVVLNGTTAQTINGTSAIPNFTNFRINNTDDLSGNAVTLNKPITVDGVFTLTDGHLKTTATNILTIGTAASVLLNAPVTQDSSFVRGPMAHLQNATGSVTKVYPVGANDNLMHRADLFINHSVAAATTYTAEYLWASALLMGWTLPATLDAVSNYGQWDITKSGASTLATGSVKLFYRTQDAITTPADLRVAKGNPNAWVDIGGVGTTVPEGDITSTINFTTFSRFALANKLGGSNPLPIELLTFDAKPNNEIVDLNWTTASESNNDYFTIEKTLDGTNFEIVEKVNAAGNSTSVLNYSTKDTHPYEGVSYYRLKQTDFNGAYTYSNLVSVEFKANAEFSFNVYPNPNEGSSINIALKANKGEEVLVVVYDVTGKQSYSKIIVTEDNGEQVYAIDPSQKLAPGVYLITGTTNQSIYSKKLIVK